MTEIYSIKQPELFHIRDGLQHHYGGNQAWYKARTQRLSGCGPTTCAHLIWYLARTREDCKMLWERHGTERSDFLMLMEDVWNFVTPGVMGVNNTAVFADGAVRYGKEKGNELITNVLKVPARPVRRLKLEDMESFLIKAFEKDLPVAFLNLSNGALQNLESWHWVTLLSYDKSKHTALMYDQGLKKNIDLGLWLQTTLQGGGFVTVEVS